MTYGALMLNDHMAIGHLHLNPATGWIGATLNGLHDGNIRRV